jgi:hypothetical protein
VLYCQESKAIRHTPRQLLSTCETRRLANGGTVRHRKVEKEPCSRIRNGTIARNLTLATSIDVPRQVRTFGAVIFYFLRQDSSAGKLALSRNGSYTKGRLQDSNGDYQPWTETKNFTKSFLLQAYLRPCPFKI